jgi:hypothetical protein
MYNLYVVYYINGIVNNNYIDWLNNQIPYVLNLNATIYIVATLIPAEEVWFCNHIRSRFPNENIIIQCNYENEYEYPGILKVWEIGQEHNKSTDIILYFHSKGVTGHPNYSFNKMDDYNIILKDYNKIKSIFTKYNKIDKVGYKCGGIGWIWYNFWYVRGSYVKLVEKPIKTTRRHYYEDWLGRKVKDETELVCVGDVERPYDYYENTLLTCYCFYKDNINWNIGSFYDPGNNLLNPICSKEMYLFDWIHYVKLYADLKHIKTEKEAVQHWFTYGQKEGRNARMYIFDWEYYLNTYPELKMAGINTRGHANWHWLYYGSKEGKHANKHHIDYVDYI